MPSSEAGQNTLNEDRLRCSTCNKQFTRLEHLHRHELIHTKRRHFPCEHCGKEFLRKDALHRHILTHQITGPNLLQRRVRACLQCAAAKARCSGDSPTCRRCEERNVTPCVYPGNEEGSLNFEAGSSSVSNQIHNNGDMFVTMTVTNQTNDSESGFVQQNILDNGPTFGSANMNQFEQSFWDPNMLSTINWLADDNQVFPFDISLHSPASNQIFPFQPLPQLFANDTVAQSPSVAVARSYHQEGHTSRPTDIRREVLSSDSVVSPRTTVSSSRTQDDEVHEGEYYVDGQAARLPRVKRRRLTTTSPATFVSVGDKYSLMVEFDISVLENKPRIYISDHVYHDLQRAFNVACLDSIESSLTSPQQKSPMQTGDTVQPPRSIFSSKYAVGIAPKAVFEYLFHVYIDSFLPLLPIFHGTAFQNPSWQIVLAICAIGSHLAEVEGLNILTPALHEFLRRVLFLAEEDRMWLPTSRIDQCRVKILHIVGMMYSGRETSLHSSLRASNELIATHVKHVSIPTNATNDVSIQWTTWIAQETMCRVSYAIWLLDALISIHFQERAAFRLEDAISVLPCHEDVWNAESSEDWMRLSSRYPSVGTLEVALQRLYVEKTLLSCTGEFSRILLIHGLFRRLWEVESYFKQPLSHWIPTAKKQSGDALSSHSPLWLPSHPTYAQWRNSACDCLDILHWSANATIGLASGLEHPTVLHLHFARVVLLTPYQSIVALAKHLAGESEDATESSLSADKQAVRRWALQDQYKARLAMIHAGVSFWHVRRYSASAFYEPASVAIATLALWAFSAFSDRSGQSEQRSNQAELETPASLDDEEAVCEIILLDRPTDDELVQQFVREGHKMRANMNGVGDLYAKTGPVRVLIEGRKLLKSLTCWSICDQWIKLLDKLIEACKRQQRQVAE